MSKSIRRFLSFFLVLQLIIPYSIFAAVTGEFSSVIGGVKQTRGKEVIKPVVKSPIQVKDIILTDKDSSAMMVFPDNSMIKLEQNSKLEIKEFLFKEKSRTAIFSLAVGKMSATVNKFIGDNNVFEVNSPTAIVGVRGTGFEFVEALNAENKNMATVSCTEGSLNLSALSPAGTVVSTGVLEAGQVAVIVGGIITISAITAALVGASGASATTSGAGTAAAATTATTATTATAATAGISTTTIVGVAAGVAAVGVAGAAASGGGDGGGGDSTPTPAPAPAPTPSTTYDATGTWIWADTYAYDSCMPAEYRTGTVTVYQTGNTFTGTHVHGGSFSGTVSGATYTGMGTHPEGDGITTDMLTFTLSSSTTGNYTNNFQWTDGTHTCSGVHKGTATKVQ